MIKDIKANNKFCKYSSKISAIYLIILGILVSLACGFILANTLRLFKRSIFIFILCSIFFSIVLGIVTSSWIKRNKYKHKRNIFIFILFCSFLIYFVFCIIFMYILFCGGHGYYEGYDENSNSINFVNFLLWTLDTWPLRYGMIFWDPGGGLSSDNYNSLTMWYIINYLNTITSGSISVDTLIIMTNSLFWFLLYMITVFCTWMYTMCTCPWLSEGEKYNWLQSIIKKLQRRTE